MAGTVESCILPASGLPVDARLPAARDPSIIGHPPLAGLAQRNVVIAAHASPAPRPAPQRAFLRGLIVAALGLNLPGASADTLPLVDPATAAATWETQADGVALRLTQILPDQARAFYLNRGFGGADAERYATACVFMTVLRNDAAPGVVSFQRDDWRVRVHGVSRRVPSVEEWLALWQRRGLSDAARIAFRWAQFPPEQEYARGEWNQGMLATGLRPGTVFDLVAHWQVDGKPYEGVLKNVRCAPR